MFRLRVPVRATEHICWFSVTRVTYPTAEQQGLLPYTSRFAECKNIQRTDGELDLTNLDLDIHTSWKIQTL
jgi:hypothetical protein